MGQVRTFAFGSFTAVLEVLQLTLRSYYKNRYRRGANMTTHDLVNLLEDAVDSDPMFYHRVSGRIAENEPKLQSLLWMLREGVMAPTAFQQAVASAVRD